MSKAWTDWEHVTNAPARQDRYSLQRLVGYEHTTWDARKGIVARAEGKGVAININDGGLCLLMEKAPTVGDVLRLQMPGSDGTGSKATLAQVRWVRPLPVGQEDVHLVGVKFLLVRRSAE